MKKTKIISFQQDFNRISEADVAYNFLFHINSFNFIVYKNKKINKKIKIPH